MINFCVVVIVSRSVIVVVSIEICVTVAVTWAATFVIVTGTTARGSEEVGVETAAAGELAASGAWVSAGGGTAADSVALEPGDADGESCTAGLGILASPIGIVAATVGAVTTEAEDAACWPGCDSGAKVGAAVALSPGVSVV
jgi:hypothetical protein